MKQQINDLKEFIQSHYSSFIRSIAEFGFRRVALSIVILTGCLMASCTTTVPRKNPVGEVFPNIEATALDSKLVNIPRDLRGEKVLLLIGYKQKSQFDIDRWLIGIDQKGYKVNVFEVPTVQGWIPRLMSKKIDEGMRSGIPQDLWKIVVTVYKDADKVVEFLGSEDPLNARVVVLGEKGQVLYFHDRGFSVPALNDLAKFFQEDGTKPAF